MAPDPFGGARHYSSLGRLCYQMRVQPMPAISVCCGDFRSLVLAAWFHLAMSSILTSFSSLIFVHSFYFWAIYRLVYIRGHTCNLFVEVSFEGSKVIHLWSSQCLFRSRLSSPYLDRLTECHSDYSWSWPFLWQPSFSCFSLQRSKNYLTVIGAQSSFIIYICKFIFYVKI